MHVPDGFLDARTAIATGTLAVAGLALALRQARRHLPPKRIPLLGLAAAFVFAAQMINFPVIGGTSGHLVGSVLAAVLLGPSAAVVVIAAVLIVQCFMFADGGIAALGANILNMGLIGGVGGWTIYYLLTRKFKGLAGCVMAAAFAAWCSTVLAAIACAGQLAVSRVAPWSLALPAMAGIHMLIGIGEGLITALVLVGIARTRPELLQLDHTPRRNISLAPACAYTGLITLGLVLFASPFASTWPDGLDRTAERLGFKSRAAAILPAPIPDYAMPGIPWTAAATSIAGLIGAVAVFTLAWVLARALVPRAASSPTAQEGPK